MISEFCSCSVGYLPAEHIETPTERLARLNKHRNIDLSATMLGDTAEKSKNPLKKAMRRRNAKTVQFGTPTYVEASDYDYSSDEGEGELFGGPEPKQVQQQQEELTEKAEAEPREDLKVQPLKLGGAKKDGQPDGAVRSSGEEVRAEEDAGEDVDRPMDPKVSRNGTLRNTDSFFKDENTETRKITLTPNLLRDDSSTSTTGSRERGPSLESLEKNGFADKVKDDKKKKEKKQGMLSGLFKRKDKKDKKGPADSTESDMEKQSEEIDRHSPQPKPSEETLSERSSAEQLAPTRQSSKGKLQKAQRNRDDSPQKTKGILKTDSPTEATSQPTTSPDAIASQPSQLSPTMRLVPSEQEDLGRTSVDEKPASRNPFSSNHPQNAPKPVQVKKAKKRIQLDDFDTDEEDEDNDPFADPDAQPKTSQIESSEPTARLSESPVHVSAADAQPSSKPQTRDPERETDVHQPPGLTQDTSSQETSSPASTPTPDDSPMKTIPENTTLIIPPSETTTSPTHLSPTATHIPPPSRAAPKPDLEMHHSPPTSSESTQQLPPWSDAALRAYLDDSSDVRDMLLVVNDTTGVVPVGRDHPFMKQYLVEDTKQLAGMSSELDRLLNGLMEKRMKRSGSGASKRSGNEVRS